MMKAVLATFILAMFTLSTGTALSGQAACAVRPKQLTELDPGSIPVKYSMVMGNPGGSKKLYVFTDPDCPFCRTLHAELKQLEKIVPDVAIHIMLMPLPSHPLAYDKARVIIAGQDKGLLDSAFEGRELPKPVGIEGRESLDVIIRFANQNRISKTPTLIMPDGRVMTGSMSAERLRQLLDGK